MSETEITVPPPNRIIHDASGLCQWRPAIERIQVQSFDGGKLVIIEAPALDRPIHFKLTQADATHLAALLRRDMTGTIAQEARRAAADTNRAAVADLRPLLAYQDGGPYYVDGFTRDDGTGYWEVVRRGGEFETSRIVCTCLTREAAEVVAAALTAAKAEVR